MNDDASKTPLEFRLRVVTIAAAYAAGFLLGPWIQSAWFHGSDEPTIAVLGGRWGQPGVEFFASIAALLAILAWLIRWWGSSYQLAGVVVSGDVVTQTLTASGPYRFVRNPLYLGNVLLALSIGSLGPPAATVMVVALNLVVVYRLIAIEERFLSAAHGAAYDRYRSAVPRLLPRVTPAALPSDGRAADVPYGFITEIFSLGFACAMVYVAIVVVPAQGAKHVYLFFWLIVGIAVVVQSLLSPAARRARGLRP